MIITTTKHSPWQEGKTSSCRGIRLEIGNKKQKIRGFGACFNELNKITLDLLPEEEEKAVLDEFFGKDGCNFNFCRMPVGANDFSEEFYSFAEVENDFDMEHFSVERDEKNVYPFIREALSRQKELQLFATPWCPPLWLKTKKVYSNGRFDAVPEKLSAYARYFRRFVEEMQKRGFPLIFVNPQNEPASNQRFPSCVINGKVLTDFIGNYLGPALEGTGVKIFWGTTTGPEPDFRLLSTRYSDYLGYAMRDENARKYLSGACYQWNGKFSVQQTHDDFPELEIVQSECECGDGQNDYEYAFYTFDLMRHYFRNGASAFVYWNFALEADEESTWGWKQNSLVSVKDKKLIFNPEFFVMKHFSHFVERGAEYIELEGEFSAECCAFVNPDGKKVIVAANPYEKDITITLEENSYLLPAKSFNTIVL